MTRNVVVLQPKQKLFQRTAARWTVIKKLLVWEVEGVWHTKMESIWRENRFHGKDLPGEIKIIGFDIKSWI